MYYIDGETEERDRAVKEGETWTLTKEVPQIEKFYWIGWKFDAMVPNVDKFRLTASVRFENDAWLGSTDKEFGVKF